MAESETSSLLDVEWATCVRIADKPFNKHSNCLLCGQVDYRAWSAKGRKRWHTIAQSGAIITPKEARRTMCEHHCHVEKGWKGWIDVPLPHLTPCTGRWFEISHTITEDLARIPSFPAPRIRRIKSLPDAVANLTELCMVAHHGTHVDAPIHYISDGPSMDEVPLERLYGQGVVWHIDREPNGVIRAEDFEAARPRLRMGDIVILDTGSARHVNTESYWDHPTVSGEAAEWLVHQGVKLLAIDAPTPDLSPKNRPANYEFPAHHTLLSRGVLIAEHMTKLETLTGRRVEAMFMALNLKGSDGGPARVVARPID